MGLSAKSNYWISIRRNKMDFETMEYLDRKQKDFEEGLDRYLTRED